MLGDEKNNNPRDLRRCRCCAGVAMTEADDTGEASVPYNGSFVPFLHMVKCKGHSDLR